MSGSTAATAAAELASASVLSSLGSPSDYFNVGSVVSVKTCSEVQLKGEVVAFDPKTKILILKLPSSCSSRSTVNDIHLINLNMVSDVEVLQENKESPPPLPDLNTTKLTNRLRDNIEKKKRTIMAYKTGISPQGQSLFRAISKTLDEVVWKNEDILVMNAVTITPPYKPDNVRGQRDSQAFKHIKKIVEKHVNDEATTTVTATTATSSSSGHPSSNSNASSKETTPVSTSSSGGRESQRTTGGGGGGSRSNAISSSNSRNNNNRENAKPMYNNHQ